MIRTVAALTAVSALVLTGSLALSHQSAEAPENTSVGEVTSLNSHYRTVVGPAVYEEQLTPSASNTPVPTPHATAANINITSNLSVSLPATATSYTVTATLTNVVEYQRVVLQKYDAKFDQWSPLSIVSLNPKDGVSQDVSLPFDVQPGMNNALRIVAYSSGGQTAISTYILLDVGYAKYLTLDPVSAVTDLKQLQAQKKGFIVTVAPQSVSSNNYVTLTQTINGNSVEITRQATAAAGSPQMTLTAPALPSTQKSAVTYTVALVSNTQGYLDALTPLTYTVAYTAKAITVQSADLPNGKTLNINPSIPFTISGKINSSKSHSAALQYYDTAKKKWVTAQSGTTDTGGRFSLKMNATTKEETRKWRVYISAISGESGADTGSTTVVRKFDVIVPSASATKTKMVPWENNNIVFNVNRSRTATQFQVLQGSSWKTIGKATTAASAKKFTVTFSVPKGSTSSADSVEKYRLFVPKPDSYFKDGASSTVIITKENPNNYTGLRKSVYNYVKGYCPAVFIGVDHSLAAQGMWGVSYLGEQRFNVYDQIPAKYLQTVSLHECGHQKQWALYSKDWNNFKNAMNPIYASSGNGGMERNADCIANYWHTNSYYAYGGNCYGNRQTVASKIANGQRY